MEHLREHLRDKTIDRDTPVAKHFNTRGHSIQDVAIKIMEIIQMDPEESHVIPHRRSREILDLPTGYNQPMGNQHKGIVPHIAL
jgi:hypothetical protein